MAEDHYEVIIVGAGPAGSAAAYALAQAGVEVVLVERGETPGSKNLSGGVLYGHALHALIPAFWEQAPVERRIINQALTFLTPDSSLSVDFKTEVFTQASYNAFTVLRSKFDRWFAEQAEAAGAMLVPGIRVDGLIQRDGRVVGIAAGEEEMLADVVIAADGANSFLAQQAGLRERLPLKHVAVGVKCLIGLPPAVIEDRFRLQEGEGTAFAIVGDVTHGVAGGGFLYTNKESLSAGVVLRLDDLARSGKSSAEILDDFLAHPFTAPFVKGGKLLEYGAHLVPEGGFQMVPRLYTGGLLVAGDAAGFAINSGLVVRGMDLAIGSGRAAAQAVLQARQKGDFTAQGLSAYSSILKESFVMQDLKTYARTPAFFERDRLYTVYPQFVTGLMNRLFTFDGAPREHILPSVWKSLRDSKVPLTRLAVDGLEGVRAL